MEAETIVSKLALIIERGCTCEYCKRTGKPVLPQLKAVRMDKAGPLVRSNLVLVCGRCYIERGLNKRRKIAPKATDEYTTKGLARATVLSLINE